LNEKLGRADLEAFSKSSSDSPKDLFGVSIADIGRLPEAREKVDGAEEGDGGWAGKTNGGFGGGRSARGEGCGWKEEESA